MSSQCKVVSRKRVHSVVTPETAPLSGAVPIGEKKGDPYGSLVGTRVSLT